MNTQNSVSSVQGILHAIYAERRRQDRKWGTIEERATKLDNWGWLAILMEEVGEIAKAMLEHNPAQMRTEIVHAAAVCFAWLEWLDYTA